MYVHFTNNELSIYRITKARIDVVSTLKNIFGIKILHMQKIKDLPTSRSMVVLLQEVQELGMGQVQNGRLYIGYRSSPQKDKQRSAKSLQSTSLGYSIAKSAL